MPPMIKDYYKVLGVPPLATPEDIRKAYRTLSKKYHPDLNPDLKIYSDQKMKELVGAYNVLNDSDKRKEYDRLPHFQIRKSKKSERKRKGDKKKGPDKPVSFITKLANMLTKKKDKGGGEQYDPKQADIHFTLGITMAENDSFIDQAKNEFKLSMKFDPHNKEAQYNLALVCYKLGEFEESLLNFQKVLTMDKDEPHAKMMVNLLREEEY